MTVFVSDNYVLRMGDNIQAYSIYSVRRYSKVENDIFLKKIIASVNKPLKINESEYVCHTLTTDRLPDYTC
jgi:transcriptional regulator of NAD metabolism